MQNILKHSSVYKLIFDAGLVVLIWMTQLIVYPSFVEFDPNNLQSWHESYTFRISLIVMPLMIGQMGIHVYDVSHNFHRLKLLTFILVILAWANTFFFAVPLHNQIAMGVNVLVAAEQLVPVNMYRTVFWSLVFVMDLYLFNKK